MKDLQQEIRPDTTHTLLQGAHPRRRIYKLVLTGGPCGGKTTGQAKLATFFENLGWKVFRVPETATVLMSGGIAFGELNEEQIFDFQENLIRTMIALEDTYFTMAAKSDQNCLVICDRGLMDASAYIEHPKWLELLKKLHLQEESMCEDRYHHVVHMVSAAYGAEDFYSVDGHEARYEGLELARERDQRSMEAWGEHPYVDVVDNRADFETKLKHLVDVVVKRIGIEVGDRFKANSKKLKFLVSGPLPEDLAFPKFTDFEVVHHYLQQSNPKAGAQSRLRKRGRNGRWSYTCTVRRPECKGQAIEVKTPLSKKDYEYLLNHVDEKRLPVYKTRRCFVYNNQQYQLDIYRDPCHSRCRGLMLLETFTTLPRNQMTELLPPFLSISEDITGDPAFSMFNLSLRSEWMESKQDFCNSLVPIEDSESEEDDEAFVDAAHHRLNTLHPDANFSNTSSEINSDSD